MAIPLPQIFGPDRTAKVRNRGFSEKPVLNPKTGKMTPHRAVDLSAPLGTPIHALASGKVKKVDYDPINGYYLEIDHGDNYVTKHSHLKEKPSLIVGQNIDNGQFVARVGSTGGSTGPHLHLSLQKNGKAIDPTTIDDLETYIRPRSQETTTAQTVQPSQLLNTNSQVKNTQTVQNTQNTNNIMANRRNTQTSATGGYQKDGRGKVYATTGDMASDILGKGIGSVTAGEIMTMAMNQGLSRRDAQRAARGLEKFKSLGGNAEMVFDPNSNRYNVLFKDGDNVEVDPRQGRRLGGNAKVGAADLIGLGRDVNYLAEVVSRSRKKAEEPGKTESAESAESPKASNEPEAAGIMTRPDMQIDWDYLSKFQIPKVKGEDEIEDIIVPDEPEQYDGYDPYPDIKRRMKIGMGEDFTARLLESMGQVVKSPASIAGWLTETLGLPKEGFGGGDSYVTQFKNWVEGRQDKYRNYQNPKYDQYGLYNALADAPEYVTAGRLVKGIPAVRAGYRGATAPVKAVTKVAPTAPKPSGGGLVNPVPKSVTSTVKKPIFPGGKSPIRGYRDMVGKQPSSPVNQYPTGTIGGEMGVVRQAGTKYADEIAKAVKSNPNAKSLVLKDGTRVRLKKGNWEAFKEGGKMSLPKYQRGDKFPFLTQSGHKEMFPSLFPNKTSVFDEKNPYGQLALNQKNNASRNVINNLGKTSQQSVELGPGDTRAGDYGKGLNPDEREFGLSDVQSIAKYAMPLTELMAARNFQKNVKKVPYSPVQVRTGAVRDLPGRPSPIMRNVANRGSDVLTSGLIDLQSSAINRAAENAYNMQNQQSRIGQEQAIMDRENQVALMNARMKMAADQQNTQMANMAQRGMSEAIRNIGLATQGNLANDAAQRAMLAGSREANLLRLMAQQPGFFTQEQKEKMFNSVGLVMQKPSGKRGLKFKISK
jgi:hypothetical protein